MAVKIIHKKNDTPGVLPTNTDLTFGEFGVNAADGDVFIRILMDPAGNNTADNQQILSVRRPLYADGGVITVGSETFRLQTHSGDNLITHADDHINTEHT